MKNRIYALRDSFPSLGNLKKKKNGVEAHG